MKLHNKLNAKNDDVAIITEKNIWQKIKEKLKVKLINKPKKKYRKIAEESTNFGVILALEEFFYIFDTFQCQNDHKINITNYGIK